MACDFPLRAYRSASERTSTGKLALTFNPHGAIQSTHALEIPCGNCMGCKLEYSRQWKIRMWHESKQHNENCFVTLTYNDQTVPQDYGLHLEDMQNFIKRLRYYLGKQRLRFFACGEYGDLNGRPHYHAILFGWDPPDKKHYKTINEKPHYQSEILNKAWQYKGLATSADVTPQSCAYVARYVTKKIKTADEVGKDRYYRLSPVDGAFHAVKPEFATMSGKPGIGRTYVDRFKGDFFPSGFIVVEGRRERPPRYYLQQLTEDEQKQLQLQNLRHAPKRAEKTMERRLAKASVRDERIKRLKRTL